MFIKVEDIFCCNHIRVGTSGIGKTILFKSFFPTKWFVDTCNSFITCICTVLFLYMILISTCKPEWTLHNRRVEKQLYIPNYGYYSLVMLTQTFLMPKSIFMWQQFWLGTYFSDFQLGKYKHKHSASTDGWSNTSWFIYLML